MTAAKTLMIQGTGSSVGKSLLVAALCRLFRRQGVRVAPFKSQNMSLNSFVTTEGHEMGRAQVTQAEAAGLPPSALMNPVLLKPCGNRTSQVIVNGQARATMTAREYYAFRHTLREDVMRAFTALADRYDLVIIEGAGSPAEINLRENDIANMGMAAMAEAPVLLVGDIDRGGVFASLYGTVKLLEPDEQRRIQGLVINKFRGDPGILDPGLRRLEGLLGLPVLGVLPYGEFHIDEEDSLTERLSSRRLSPKIPPLEEYGVPKQENTPLNAGTGPAAGIPLQRENSPQLDIAVIRLPRLSNFTDFAVFDILPDVALRYAANAAALRQPDLVILPGSKNTLEDLRFLHDSGLAECIALLHQHGMPVIGICGGYQMLGSLTRDPLGVESCLDAMPGLGLLPVETIFAPHKHTRQARQTVRSDRGMLRGAKGLSLCGYEIHMGRTRKVGQDFCEAFAHPDKMDTDQARHEGDAGTVNAQGTVFGTYLHGLFDNLAFTRTLLNNLRAAKGLAPLSVSSDGYADFREREYDRLADMAEASLDMALLRRIIDLPQL